MSFIGDLSPYAFQRGKGGSVLDRLAREHCLDPALIRMRPHELSLRLGRDTGVLVADLLRLGPMGVLSPHGQGRLVQSVRPLDFKSVPETAEFVDLNGALHLDLAGVSSILAVEEQHARGSLLSLQFLDRRDEGLLKLYAIPDSNFAEFGGLLQRHTTAWAPIGTAQEATPSQAVSGDGSGLNPHIAEQLSLDWDLHDPFNLDAPYAWTSLAGYRPGEFFPHLDAMFVEPATPRFIAAFLLNAHLSPAPLEAVGFSQGFRHQVSFRPERVEECCHGVHLLSEDAQMMIPRKGLSPWRTEYGTSPGPCLEFLDAQGFRRLALRYAA